MHPFKQHAQDKSGRSRAKHLTRAYAEGGSIGDNPQQQRNAMADMPNPYNQSVNQPANQSQQGNTMKPLARARGGKVGKVTVNVITPPHSQERAASPPLPPPPAMGPPGPPPGVPPVRPGGGAGPFARGGKVAMTGGADSGIGRLDKVKAYKGG